MRSALLCLFVLVFSALAQAQTPVIQTGFAIITVESGNSAGLAPVETLIHNESGVTTTTDVPPAPLLTNSAMVINLGTFAAGETGLAIVNPTASAGHVLLSVTDPFGTSILNQTITILPRGQLSRFVNELFAGQITSTTPATGLLTITADVPVGVAALNFRADGFSASPLTSLSSPMPLSATTFTPVTNVTTTGTTTVFPVVSVMPSTSSVQTTATASTTVGGGASFLLPQVVTGAGWSTQITVANNSAGQQALRIDFFDPNGVLLKTITGITIQPRGLFSAVQ